MKKKLIALTVWAFVSLACLLPVRPLPVGSVTGTSSPTGTLTKATQTVSAQRCVRVAVLQAQNLRAAPGLEATIIDWLKDGAVLRVIDQANPDWWQVTTGTRVGFARSSFLVVTDCLGVEP